MPLDLWASTVFTLRLRLTPICLLVWPHAMRRSTSASRGLSGRGCDAGRTDGNDVLAIGCSFRAALCLRKEPARPRATQKGRLRLHPNRGKLLLIWAMKYACEDCANGTAIHLSTLPRSYRETSSALLLKPNCCQTDPLPVVRMSEPSAMSLRCNSRCSTVEGQRSSRIRIACGALETSISAAMRSIS